MPLFQAEADLDAHLEVGHLALGNVPTDFGHLEPADIVDGFLCL